MYPEISKLIRKELLALEPYHVPFHPGVVKLDANENTYDFPPEVWDDIVRAVDGQTFGRYPDPTAADLRAALAGYTGVAPEQISVGNGSDELIQNLMLTFATGGKVVIATPTFGMYAVHATIAGATPVPLPRGPDFSVDPEAVIAAAGQPGVRVVILCSPNNPTGNTIPLEVTRRILEGTRAVVVVDEAYYEFCGETAVPLLADYPHLVLLRTFSKAFGLAGLRVGYMLAGKEVTEAVGRVKQPFNVNAFSQLAAARLLKWRPVFAERIRKICLSRDELLAAMQGVPGVTVYPSRGNFLLFRTALPARTVYEGLLKRGVLVRILDGPDLPGCLRVSVGQPGENAQFLKALAETMASGASAG
jgi:histidinol-phosphate aminotransferase